MERVDDQEHLSKRFRAKTLPDQLNKEDQCRPPVGLDNSKVTIKESPQPKAIKIRTPSKFGDLYTDFIMIVAKLSGRMVVEVQEGNKLEMELPDGDIIQDSVAIAQYLAADTNLVGGTDFEKSLVDQWLCYLREDLTPLVKAIQWYSFGHLQCSAAEFTFVQSQYKECMKVINKALSKQYLVGDNLTLPDIYLVLS